jgi:signal transduction histidine kinase/ligand-binding sensor domain-containing protein
LIKGTESAKFDPEQVTLTITVKGDWSAAIKALSRFLRKSLPSVSFAVVIVWLFAGEAYAVNPDRRISQYAHTAWRMQEGAFDGVPNAIVQTSDGYIWIGTESGLIRFDGVKFTPWNPPSGRRLPSSNVLSLLNASDGSLWIGTTRGLSHWKNKDLVNYTNEHGRIDSIVEDSEKRVWIVRTRSPDIAGPLCQVIGDRLRCYGRAEGIPFLYAGDLVQDYAGNLWVGGTDTFSRWRFGSSTTYKVPTGLKSGVVLGTMSLAASRDGSLWVGMPLGGAKLGLQQLIHGMWKPFVAPGLDGSSLEVETLFLDRDNALWVGTNDQGIYRIYGNKAEHFGSADGLSSDSINGFFQDREGNLWVATSKGVDSFRDLRVTTFSEREGLSTDSVSAVVASRDGTVWISNGRALDSFRDEKISSMTARNGLPGREVTSLLEDHEGNLWLGVDNGLFVYEGGKFHEITESDGRSLGAIESMAEDSEHNIWAETIGEDRHLVRIFNRRLHEEVPSAQIPRLFYRVAPDPEGGIWLSEGNHVTHYQNGQLKSLPIRLAAGITINDIFSEPDGGFWGASSEGLTRWLHGQSKMLSTRNGLPCNNVYAIIRDRHNSLWLYSECGLVTITDSELHRWWDSPDTTINLRKFDVFDGLQPALSTFRPKATRSVDGRLWFANDEELQVIDPDHLDGNTIPPPVHIEQIVADRRDYSPQENLRFPPRTRDIEINYTALSFVMPQRVRFRYRLEGYDTNWREAGTRRTAYYSNLKPGRYRFRVIACNNDGIWNEVGANSSFVIAPAYFQTLWFQCLCALLVVLLVVFVYQLRVRQIAARLSVRFDIRLAERTRLARELHDTLLQTIQGSKLVAEGALASNADPDRMRQTMERVAIWLGQAIVEGREALQALRSSTEQSDHLLEILQKVAQDYCLYESMQVVFSVEGEPVEMHPIVRDEIYRIAHEAIRNACQHSKASHLKVQLRYAQDFILRVNDNGVGMGEEILAKGKKGHFGLQGMEERAARVGGKLYLSSSSHLGTTIELVVPRAVVSQRPRTMLSTLRRTLKDVLGEVKK